MFDTSTQKQILINRLPLPQDIHREIKQFLFFHPITSYARLQQKQIIQTILHEANTMFNMNIWFHPHPDPHPDPTYYTFSHYPYHLYHYPNQHTPLHIQIQVEFCLLCGNYSPHYLQSPASLRVICTCIL